MQPRQLHTIGLFRPLIALVVYDPQHADNQVIQCCSLKKKEKKNLRSVSFPFWRSFNKRRWRVVRFFDAETQRVSESDCCTGAVLSHWSGWNGPGVTQHCTFPSCLVVNHIKNDFYSVSYMTNYMLFTENGNVSNKRPQLCLSLQIHGVDLVLKILQTVAWSFADSSAALYTNMTGWREVTWPLCPVCTHV